MHSNYNLLYSRCMFNSVWDTDFLWYRISLLQWQWKYQKGCIRRDYGTWTIHYVVLSGASICAVMDLVCVSWGIISRYWCIIGYGLLCIFLVRGLSNWRDLISIIFGVFLVLWEVSKSVWFELLKVLEFDQHFMYCRLRSSKYASSHIETKIRMKFWILVRKFDVGSWFLKHQLTEVYIREEIRCGGV